MSKRLGRGLADLIQASPAQTSGNNSSSAPPDPSTGFVLLRLDQIKPSRFQPRTGIADSDLQELAESIRRQGVLEPLLVRPLVHGTYELVAGERRWRAAREAGLVEVPVLIKNWDDKQTLECALIENVQRENLNPIEEAQGYARLMEEFHYTQEQAAERVGRQRATVANLVRLLKLPESIQKALREDAISFGHAKVLLSIEDRARQLELFEAAVKNGWSVRALEEHAHRQPGRAHIRARAASPADAQQKQLEEQLQRALGTKVSLAPRSKGGRVVIEYYSPEDLERLMSLFGVPAA